MFLLYTTYKHFHTTSNTQYVLGTATVDTIVSSVSASGQITANDTLDLKPKASGQVVYVPVVAGTANSDGSLTAQSIQIRPAGLQIWVLEDVLSSLYLYFGVRQ